MKNNLDRKEVEVKPKYPQIVVDLTGYGDHVFATLGKVANALADNGVSQPECRQFCREAATHDFAKLLQVCKQWVTVIEEEEKAQGEKRKEGISLCITGVRSRRR